MPPGVEDGEPFGHYVPPEEVPNLSLPGGSLKVLLGHHESDGTAASRVFGWRKRFADEPTALPAAQLVPVMVTPDRADTPPPPPAADIIEIELPSGHRVRIGGGVKATSLRLVLDALERR